MLTLHFLFLSYTTNTTQSFSDEKKQNLIKELTILKDKPYCSFVNILVPDIDYIVIVHIGINLSKFYRGFIIDTEIKVLFHYDYPRTAPVVYFAEEFHICENINWENKICKEKKGKTESTKSKSSSNGSPVDNRPEDKRLLIESPEYKSLLNESSKSKSPLNESPLNESSDSKSLESKSPENRDFKIESPESNNYENRDSKIESPEINSPKNRGSKTESSESKSPENISHEVVIFKNKIAAKKSCKNKMCVSDLLPYIIRGGWKKDMTVHTLCSKLKNMVEDKNRMEEFTQMKACENVLSWDGSD